MKAVHLQSFTTVKTKNLVYHVILSIRGFSEPATKAVIPFWSCSMVCDIFSC